MRPYAVALVAILILTAGLLVAANVQPILTGLGYIKFPENAIPAYIYASGGALRLVAGGPGNDGIELTPTGTGTVLATARTMQLQAPSDVATLRINSPFANWASELRFGDDTDTDGVLLIHGNSSYSPYGGANAFNIWNNRNALIRFATNNTPRWDIGAAGDWLAVADNSFNIGAAGANRPKNVYVAGTIIAGSTVSASGYKIGATAGASGTDSIGNVFNGGIVTTVGSGSTSGFTSFSLVSIANNTDYQNTSGKVQYIQVPASITGIGSVSLAYCDGTATPSTVASIFSDTVVGVQYGTLSFMVLPNYYWKIDAGTTLYDGKARVWQ